MSHQSIQNPRPERLPITRYDLENIRKVRLPGLYKSAAVEIANSVERQNWISPRQREILGRVANRAKAPNRVRGRGYYQSDYDEADWELNAYDLCIDGWGD